jgi:hypothetical protein
LAADALAWCGASRAEPLSLEGLRERFLPEHAGRGRDQRKLQFAVLAAATMQGGAEPDLLDVVAWWQADGFWQHARLTAVTFNVSGPAVSCWRTRISPYSGSPDKPASDPFRAPGSGSPCSAACARPAS